jgi:E3 ubiquitin-protein ligase RNF14
MAAAAFPGTASLRASEPHRSGRFLDEAPSSSCSTLGGVEVESSSVACEGGGEAEEGLLDLDSPWVAADEAESRLGAAATAVPEGPGYGAEDGNDEEDNEIRDNQQRQEDEVWHNDLVIGLDFFLQFMIMMWAAMGRWLS